MSGMLVPLPLARPFLLQVLGGRPSLADLVAVDAQAHTSLLWLQNTSIDSLALELVCLPYCGVAQISPLPGK